MGQVMRAMSYDRAANERNAVSCLILGDTPLSWHRLDDGVMGGQSETDLHSSADSTCLLFSGQINTSGGGFCSVRARIEGGLPTHATGLKISFRGDGKTYKLLISDGNVSAFGPSRRKPSWQADIPTKDGVDETKTIRLESLVPSFGGVPVTNTGDSHSALLRPEDMKEIGFMLSLKLSDGTANPKETFGSGSFPFSLMVRSIEVIEETPS
ncbi:hypothetical protein THAOC_02827 [Thalassiosira oceanica]|uniref:NADH:ubiquinone oxidoreductase intermediate-associated protein 30 domain-containing protein n=1 Tax=Thalassiosira oceanica TaxID=159749 RepID=K0T9L1_THAOC|nr:hypothetical protein THAOC_02827 [Thalassiosira oceanica]|mmetsp:Transcript_24375/g.57950  ORF Transcript_24375/g.57950 Transcript_24375/m.57950 type:complete len:211 (-) Transcript_24375:116-748(-)|eukprot:EJK75448.1 hypothetical protein THAOC_02827 [Thalassiosira oceanica]